MASGTSWMNICPECGNPVEILNGDFAFSMELHKQSHKSLNYVNNAIDGNLDRSFEKIDNARKLKFNYCNDCNENIEIVNNDLSLSFQLHVQKHKPDNADASSDHSSNSSGKNMGSQNNISKAKEQTQPVLTSILDAIFHTMPVGLKAHRGFITEQGCSKAVCNLCEITVEPIFSVTEHLKTKLHEDNTIQAIKTILSSELHNQMEYVSFYGSNLCCNLCRCKIDLCSNNLHKTVVNILSHNAGKGHESKKTDSSNIKPLIDNTHVILTSLALLNPLVSENQHLIEHKMYPFFKCKPCDKQILYSENQNELVNRFTNHFNSSGHGKSASAASLLSKWNGLKIPGKENHNFVVSKQSIYCLSCDSVIEANLDQLLAHIRRISTSHGNEQPQMVTSMKTSTVQNVWCDNSLSSEKNMRNNHEEVQIKQSIGQQKAPPVQEVSAKLRRLLQSLPVQFRNIIIENKKGEAVCSVCNCVIPPTNYNLITHLNGSSHARKHNEAKLSEDRLQLPKTPGTQAKEYPADFNKEFDYLASTHQLVSANRQYFVRYNEENKYICVLCGTIIPADASSFQRNILSHIESQDHVYKVQLKGEMSQLLPRHRVELVKEVFDLIPLSFQNDQKYIKAPEGFNFVFCEICFIKIPRHRNCLLEHLEGVYHETSVERFGKIKHKKVGIKLNDSDVQFQELLRTNKTIKSSAKYLEKKNDDYFCKPCKAVIKNSYERNVLEGNIMSHLAGKKHKKTVEDEFSEMIDKVQKLSGLVRENRKFLNRKNNTISCTLCLCQMSIADNIDALKYNLEEHFSGNSHSTRKLDLEARESYVRKLETEASGSSASYHEATSSMLSDQMTSLFNKIWLSDIGHDENPFPYKL